MLCLRRMTTHKDLADHPDKRHEWIINLSGNALPPPVYGVVCDIDDREHDQIKQRARRVPVRHLVKLNEQLNGLLEAVLISFFCRDRGHHR